MGYISKNWRGVKDSILSQKFLDRVRPEATLKNKIDDAGKKMEYQILRLEQTHNKLQQNHDNLFKKIVDAKQTRNESKAMTYAIELVEVKKAKNKISEAKLAMEQIKIRLGTVSELGDIVVTLSPCMSLIKGLAPAISSFMPGINTSMQDVSNMLGDLMSNSTLSTGSMFEHNETSDDIKTILDEAHTILETKTKSNMPIPPLNSIEDITKENGLLT